MRFVHHHRGVIGSRPSKLCPQPSRVIERDGNPTTEARCRQAAAGYEGGGEDEPDRSQAPGPRGRGGAHPAIRAARGLPAEQSLPNVSGSRIALAPLQLLATAGHVALYDFDIPTKRWARKDVEGSLFVVKRSSQPRFQMVILNKKSAGEPLPRARWEWWARRPPCPLPPAADSPLPGPHTYSTPTPILVQTTLLRTWWAASSARSTAHTACTATLATTSSASGFTTTQTATASPRC